MKTLTTLFVLILFSMKVNAQSADTEISISSEQLKETTTIYQILGLKEKNCQIYKFNVYWIKENDTVVEFYNRGKEFNEKSIKMFQQLKKGDFFYIMEIESLADCINYHFRIPTFKISVK